MKVPALAMTMALAMTTAFAQQTSSQLSQAQGARVLERLEVEQLVAGARVSISDSQGATRTWTHNGRGSVIATLDRAHGAARSLHGKGHWSVNENGGYCIRIEWPRSEEAWCRRILSVNGGYYAVSDDPRDSTAFALDVVRPNRSRLSALSRLLSLARISAGAIAP